MVTESTIIHAVPLETNTYHVLVKTAVNPEARLPIPIGDGFVYIKDIVHTMVLIRAKWSFIMCYFLYNFLAFVCIFCGFMFVLVF